MFEIAVDTGGTFADSVLIDDERKISAAKFPTDPNDPTFSIMGCIKLLAQQRDLTEQELLADTAALAISTTLPTNCILEEKGARCCLIHTEGFRDIFELGRQIPKADIYNLKVPPPRVLIPRHRRYGVEERLQYDGKEVTPLNKDDVLAAVKKAKEHNVEVPIICFLHSYVNPEHEEQAAAIVKKEYPDVVVSSRILRRWIEWDRLSTATLAGYVKVIVSRFLERLESQLKENNFKGTLLFTTGLAGVAAPEVCLENPALLIGSTGAAAALMGRMLGELTGIDNMIICDMGGTSFDIDVLHQRTIATTTEMEIGGFRNACEAVDTTSIGAGGGSIARIDQLGILRVGPSSAGADPGPACYGKGGQLPTVTDANVVLGYIPTDYFLGGASQLDDGLARQAIDEHVAGPLGLDTVEAAYAISSLVEANMAERIILTVVGKGFDPGDFVLVAAGGAGPIHVTSLASRLNIKQVYIPKYASVFSARGLATADYQYNLNRFYYGMADEANANELKELYESLEKEGRAILARQGISDKEMYFVRGAEIRYYGQLHDIDVGLPESAPGEPFTVETARALFQGFHDRHQALYGWADANMPAMIPILKLRAIGKRRPLEMAEQPLAGTDASGAIKRHRQAYFKELGGFMATPCYDGDALRHGNIITSPAIIEEKMTTVVLGPGVKVKVDAYGNYLAELGDKEAK